MNEREKILNMNSTQENRPTEDNELVGPINNYIDGEQPLDPEVLIKLDKSHFASLLLHFAIEQDSGTEPVKEPIWIKEEEKAREERIKKLFRFVNRRTIQIMEAGAGCSESSWSIQGSRSRSTKSIALSSRAGAAIVRRQYEGK